MIRALCEREYFQPSSVLSLDSDRVQHIEHSSGECVSCERVRHYLRAVPYTLLTRWSTSVLQVGVPLYDAVAYKRRLACKNFSLKQLYTWLLLLQSFITEYKAGKAKNFKCLVCLLFIAYL